MKRYRPLRPLYKPTTDDAATPARSRRVERSECVKVACGVCRKRKTKCTGERPKCSACLSTGKECGYSTEGRGTDTEAIRQKYAELQALRSAYEQVFNLIRSRPQEEGDEIMRQIRRGVDASTIVNQVNDGFILLQIAPVPTDEQNKRETQRPQLPQLLPKLPK